MKGSIGLLYKLGFRKNAKFMILLRCAHFLKDFVDVKPQKS